MAVDLFFFFDTIVVGTILAATIFALGLLRIVASALVLGEGLEGLTTALIGRRRWVWRFVEGEVLSVIGSRRLVWRFGEQVAGVGKLAVGNNRECFLHIPVDDWPTPHYPGMMLRSMTIVGPGVANMITLPSGYVENRVGACSGGELNPSILEELDD